MRLTAADNRALSFLQAMRRHTDAQHLRARFSGSIHDGSPSVGTFFASAPNVAHRRSVDWRSEIGWRRQMMSLPVASRALQLASRKSELLSQLSRSQTLPPGRVRSLEKSLQWVNSQIGECEEDPTAYIVLKNLLPDEVIANIYRFASR